MQTNDPEQARAILAVIDAETQAFWNKDFDAIADAWAQETWSMRGGWWERGGISWRTGWDEIADRMRTLIEQHPEPNPAVVRVRRENVRVRVGGDMAWVTFDQHAAAAGEPDMDMPGVSHETRVLEKRDGRWKIVYQCFLLE